MRTAFRRAHARLPIFTVLFAVILTVGGSSLVVGGRLAPQARSAGGNAAGVAAGAIVRVDVTGTDDTGAATTAAAYGIVVDPTGLVLAPANVVAPKSPGVAVGWQWPFIGFTVTQIVISTSVGAGQPFKPTYSASVAAVDGLLDAAVLKLDAAISPTGVLVPIPVGSLNLPAVPIAAADPAVASAVTFATYPETGTAPTGLGTYLEIPGTIAGFAPDVHFPGKNYWVNTDILTPVAYAGGAIVDATGALVAMASWLPNSPPQHVYGPDATLLAPVVAAAKAGTPYLSPNLVPGTGTEAATFTGFATGDSPCNTTAPVTTYPTGTKALAVLLGWTGFTDGEDTFDVWFDPDKQQLIAYALNQWTFGPTGTCFSNSITGGDSALPDGTYSYNLFAGGDLHFLTGAKTIVGQPGVGAVKVTGKVVDADTGKPIPFVFIYILKPGVDPQAWAQSGSQADTASIGLTDDQGLYTTDPAITPGDYPFVVIPFDAHQAIGGTVTIPADGKLADIKLTATTP